MDGPICKCMRKGGLVEETLMYKIPPYGKFEFDFPVTMFSLRTTLYSWECFALRNSVVFFRQTKNKILILSYLAGKFKFVYGENFYTGIPSKELPLSNFCLFQL